MEARASSAANFSDFMKISVTRLSNFMKDTLNGPSSPVSHDRGTGPSPVSWQRRRWSLRACYQRQSLRR
eukprot:456818-Hanusia_phi.AAC.1